MADGRHLEKSRHHHDSAVVWSISMKFGTVMHFDPFDRSDRKISKILKFQMADGRHLEKSKNSHISATDCPIGTKFGTEILAL